LSEGVVIHVRLTREQLAQFAFLTQEAIDRATAITVSRLRELAKQYTPEDTGRLLSSFDIGIVPSGLVMKWGATSPQGFNYAKVADVGRPGGVLIQAKTPRGLIWRDKVTGEWRRKMQVVQGAMDGSYYSEAMRFEARAILLEELTREIGLTFGESAA
jgi:hypothetical protein